MKSGETFRQVKTKSHDNITTDGENNTDEPVRNTNIVVTPPKAVRGSSLSITLSMNDNMTPPLPSAHESPSSITAGNLSAQFLERNNNEIVIRLEIPEVFSASGQDITITLFGPNGQMEPGEPKQAKQEQTPQDPAPSPIFKFIIWILVILFVCLAVLVIRTEV